MIFIILKSARSNFSICAHGLHEQGKMIKIKNKNKHIKSFWT